MIEPHSPLTPADEALSRYFRGELPHCWPALPLVEPRLAVPPWTQNRRAYLALAACIGLLLAGLGAVTLIKDSPRPQALPAGAGPPTANLPAGSNR